MPSGIDLAAVLSTFAETWKPRTIATVNDYDVRLVKVLGEFTWHSHPDTDELFLVLRGSLTIRTDDVDVDLATGQLSVVPRGVRHQPYSADGADVLLLEPFVTSNTGDTPSHLTTTPVDLVSRSSAARALDDRRLP